MNTDVLGICVFTETDVAMLDFVAAAGACSDDLDYSDFYLEGD